MTGQIVVLIIFLLTLFSVKLQSQDSYSDANQLIQEVIKKLHENDTNKAATFSYKALHIARRVTDKGEVEHIEEHIIFRNNRPTVISRSINHKADKISGSSPQGFNVSLRNILASKYEYTFLSTEPIPIDGKKCFIVEFRPKQGLKLETKEDQILNRTRGKIFIDKDTLLVWRFEAWLPEGFSIYTYFKAYSANIAITFQEIDGIITEQLITINGYYKNGWFASAKTLTETYTFTDFTRLP